MDGHLNSSQTVYFPESLSWWTTVTGAAIFGAGMMLTRGCPARLVVLSGSGNLRAWFGLFVIGLSAYATFKGLMAETRVQWQQTGALQLPTESILLLVPSLAWVAIAGVTGVIGVFAFRHGLNRHLVGGLLVGLLVAGSWSITSVLGADDFDPMAPVSLSFVAPIGEAMTYLQLASGLEPTFNVTVYGLTETAPVLTMNRGRAEWDDLTAGERATLLNRAGAPVIGCTMDADAEGEVLARGNMIMEGYWEQPEATAEAIRDGFFHTGDGGSIDATNYVTISDRKKDVIISGGENVSSIEVEDAIFQHPEVTEVAVIGIPDEKWGELVTALVVTSPGSSLSEEDVISWTRTKLAGYKCPKRVEFRTELARTATGKLQKFKLRQPFWDGQDRQVN